MWAVLDRASRGWRGVEMTPSVVRRLQNLRRQLFLIDDSPLANTEPAASQTEQAA